MARKNPQNHVGNNGHSDRNGHGDPATTSRVSARVPAATEERSFQILSPRHALYGPAGAINAFGDSLMGQIVRLQKLAPSGVDRGVASMIGLAPSGSRSWQIGERLPPVELEALKRIREYSEHHATCLMTKVRATVGLGFKLDTEEEGPGAGLGDADGVVTASSRPLQGDRLMSRVDERLDPLCQSSWADTLHAVCEDFYEMGMGYLEAVRLRTTDEVVALHWRAAEEVRVWVDGPGTWHYIVRPKNEETYFGNMGELRLASWGDTDACRERLRDSMNLNYGSMLESDMADATNQQTYRELIQFRQPTNRSRFYGYPAWLSALPVIDLTRALRHFYFDFFNNHGVPDLLICVSGASLSDKQWSTVENALIQNVGLGNQHKSLALNLPQENVKVEVHRLAMETKTGDTLSGSSDNLQFSIVTAHQVPPLLAGIQVPGKLGATNEFPNAMQAFQTLVCGPNQRVFQQRLGNTLGAKKEARLQLRMTDFEFYTVLDEINVQMADATARMREPVAGGRDPAKGLRN